MKNFIKNNLFGFLIGIILCSGVVYGVSYNANDITYTKGGVETNVNEALNELYNVQNELDECQEKNYKIKRTTLPNETSIDVKEYTDNWAELTVENFAIDVSGGAHANIGRGMVYGGNAYGTAVASLNYDNLTGILTISITGGSGTYPAGGSSDPVTLTANAGLSLNAVYLYEVDQG